MHGGTPVNKGTPHYCAQQSWSTQPTAAFLFEIFKIIFMVCAHVSVCVYTHREQLAGISFLPSIHVGPGDQTQVVRCCGKHIHLLSHHSSPNFIFLLN